MPWSLIEHRTVTSSVEDFTGLAGNDELLALIRGVTASLSGQRLVQVSINNGSSFLTTSGDYVSVAGDGTPANAAAIGFHDTGGNSTSGRSGAVLLSGCQLTTEKLGDRLSRDDARQIIIPTANDLDALRFSNGAGNLTGGDIWLWGRPGAFPWTLIESRAVNGVEDFTDLGGYSEIRVVLDGVTLSASGIRNLLVSTDNGSSFLSGGSDYVVVASNGSEGGPVSVGLHGTSSASARSADVSLIGFNISGAPKIAKKHHYTADRVDVITTTTALNAIRINSSAGTPNGGTIHLYGRS